MEYCDGRDTDTGPADENIGEICDQIDRADVMLTGLRDHAPHAPRPQADGPQMITLARHGPTTRRSA